MTGLCECGCGGQTAVSDRNDATLGYVKGQPFRYLPSHNRRIHRRGYVSVRVDGEARMQHVVVASRAIGKPLPGGASVHHVDGNKRNNTPSNLVICQDETYHQLLHARARVVRAGGNPNTERLCGRCLRLQPFDAFNKCQSNCRDCTRARWREWSRGEKARKHAAALAAEEGYPLIPPSEWTEEQAKKRKAA